MMYCCEHDLHLKPLNGFNDHIEEESDSSCDSDIEVISEFDDAENDPIIFNAYSNINYNNDDKDDIQNGETDSNGKNCSSSPDTSDNDTETVTGSGSVKRKRRQWSVAEKIRILDELEKNKNNKRLTAQQNCCSRFMLLQWQKQKEDLLLVAKETYGNKRKRLHGAGVKLRYPDLDQKLIEWFRERRGIIKRTDESVISRKEKVSFKQLQRKGKQISEQINHEAPSQKWYSRFLQRHCLSLQKPKRHQKIPLEEVHQAVHNFHSYLRRASRWGPRRGPMGAFTPKDVCNMDESPLSLFGDQSNLTVNDINTSNEIEGHISNKRFCSLILTVFAEDNSRIGPVLLFKGKGNISEREKNQYATDVKVFFTPKGVNNTPTMNKYISYLICKIKDNKPKLFITDSSGTHLNGETLRLLRKDSVVVAIIPKGCTMYIQALDVFVFSVFKHHYYECSEEFIEKYGPRSKIKLTASQSRVLCTRLTSSAWKRTLASVDLKKAFLDLGYIWFDNSSVHPRTLPGYSFDPLTIDYLSKTSPLDEAHQIEDEADKAKEQHLKQLNKRADKQLTILDMWKLHT